MAIPVGIDRKFPWFLQQFVTAYATGPSRALLRSFEADLLSQTQIEEPVLDLACGDGLVSAVTFGHPLDEGCDLSQEQLDKARRRRQYRTITLADARALPNGDASFATVISNSSMEHFPEVERVIREVARVLEPGGQFVFTVPGPRFNEWFWANWLCTRLRMPERGERFISNFNELREHRNVFSGDEWKRRLEQAGFSSVEVTEYLSFSYTFMFSFLEHLWTFNPLLPVPHRRGVTLKRINVASLVLTVLPRGVRRAIQVHPLLWLRRIPGDAKGSHLLILATRSGTK